MKATDLMIGDWVQTPVDKSRIICIGKYSGCFTDSTKDGERYYMPSQLKPIPLTPEILEKNGWKIDGIKGGRFYWNEIAPFYIPVGEGWSEEDEKVFYDDFYGYVLMRLITVHELQHALRLCGIDKTIEI